MEWLDVICKIATVIIALVNIIFAFIIFNRNRKRELVKTLVLDYSIQHFYKYFEDLDLELCKLKMQCSKETKKEIEKNIQSLGRIFEQRFIDLFLHINKDLHKKIKNKIDDMIGHIMESIFDEGINIHVESQYNDKIANIVIVTKASVIKLLLEESE